jgi:hypothetical protein
VEKLRPEQRKLWRKTYHQERDRGETPKIASDRADDAVNAWEARGAFDEGDETTTVVRVPHHSHARMRAIASGDGYVVREGDELQVGPSGHAVVTRSAMSVSGCVTFDVMVFHDMLNPGDRITFRNPRPGVAIEAVVITG